MARPGRRPTLVPPVFAARTALHAGAAGAAWVDRLPELVAGACRRWRLEIDGNSTHGEVALVVPVRRGDQLAVLKVSWPHPEMEPEAKALAAWAGRGAVRLLEEDAANATLLLERADASRSLEALADDEEAVTVAAALLPRLHVEPPPGLPTVASLAERWQHELVEDWRRLGRPLAGTLVDEAVATCRELGGDPGGRLLHGDFHYANVLGAEREPWLAIDPKPLVGDPAFEVVSLLRNRWDHISVDPDVAAAVRRRFDLVVDVAGLDPARARAWALTRAVDNALWGVEKGRPEFVEITTTIAAAMSARPAG